MNKRNPRRTEKAVMDRQRRPTELAGRPVKFQGERDGCLRFIHCRYRRGTQPHPLTSYTEDHNRRQDTVVDVILLPIEEVTR